MPTRLRMVKKSVKKEQTSSIERVVESNIQLQHKMADVLLGVKELNENVSSLISIFKSAGEHIKSGKYEDPLLHKLNELVEQNKNLMQALAIVEKQVKEKQQSAATRPRFESTEY